MKIEQSLFAYTKKKMLEKPETRSGEFTKLMTDEAIIEKLSVDLAAEAKMLWRYEENATPFDKELWRKTIEDAWLKTGSFPVLYKENCVYDRREVVFCLLFFAGCKQSQEEELLNLLSAGEVSFDGRPLYQLHFKEGFFKLVLAWNRLNAETVSFEEAIVAYEKYEGLVFGRCKQKWQEIQPVYGQITEEEKRTSIYMQISHYYELCKALWQEAEKWSFPLGLLQQDELQRLIVLQAHLERFLEELKAGKQYGITTRNRLTRRDTVRGTKYCDALLVKCCKQDKWESAAGLYLEEALPAMGEACWRSVSKWMKAYSECGRNAKEYDPYLSLPVRSVRNKDVKQYKKVAVFDADVPTDARYMSFAVDVEEIRKSIMKQSANTSMIAQLLQPQYRSENALFAKQISAVQQSALSLFLRSYFLWCEGKGVMKNQGIDRLPLPFYAYKRDMVIRFALACGCTSSVEMEAYLEFTGNAGLNPQKPAERLVFGALEWYGALSHDRKQSVSPVEVILTMQHYYLYHLVALCQKKYGFDVEKRIFLRFVRKFQMACIYEPEISEFSVKNREDGKKDNLQRYASLWFSVMLLLRCISMHVHSREKGLSLAKDILMRIWEEKEPFQEKYFHGYLMCVTEPDALAEEYLENLSDSCQWQELFSSVDEIDTKEVTEVLRMVSEQFQILVKVQESNSMELKLLYEVLFYVLCAVREFVHVTDDEVLEAVYGKCLEQLQDAVVLWTFAGGSQNFSLSFYEQRFGMNHYRKSHEEIDYTQGNRWLRYLHELKEDREVWDEIIMDLKTINKSRSYIEKKALLNAEKIYAMQEQLADRVEECRETLGNILSYLEEHGCEDNLVKRLRYIYQCMSL